MNIELSQQSFFTTTYTVSIYKNILSENRNDINIIANLMINIKPEITEVDIRNILINKYTEDDDSYKLQYDIAKVKALGLINNFNKVKKDHPWS